jgi:hypothetical protein
MILSSVVDGNSNSSIALIEQWFEVRGDRRGDALIDGQFTGLLKELQDTKAIQDAAKAAIAEGRDYGGPEGKGAMTTNLAGSHDFLNIELPYGELLKESSFEGLEAKMTRYDSYADASVLTAIGSSAVAGSAAAGAIGAVGVQTVGKVMFYAARHGASAAGRGSAAAGGAFAIVAATTYVFVEGMTALIQHEEQKLIFNGMVEGVGTPTNIADIDFTAETVDILSGDPKPEDMVKHLNKSLLVDALDEMLLGV